MRRRRQTPSQRASERAREVMNQQLICNLAPFFQSGTKTTTESSTNFSETRSFRRIITRRVFRLCRRRRLPVLVAWQRASPVTMTTTTTTRRTHSFERVTWKLEVNSFEDFNRAEQRCLLLDVPPPSVFGINVGYFLASGAGALLVMG